MSLSRHRRPLFMKMLGVVALTLIIVNLAVFWFWKHHFQDDERQTALRHFRQYAGFVLKGLPEPLDSAGAADFSARYGVEVMRLAGSARVHSPNALKAWAKLGGASWLEDEIEDATRSKDDLTMPHLFWRRGLGGALRVTPVDTTVILVSMHSLFPAHRAVFGLLGFLTLVMGLTALAVHHFLKPMRRLEKGVLAIERGDLGFRLRPEGHDEIARIAESFNAMADSIENRIKARDQLLSDVSHEFRSPLTRLRLAAEMLEPGVLRVDLLEDISVLEAMVQEILESERLVSPAGGLKREAVDLAELVEALAQDFAERPPGLRLALEAGLPPQLLDSTRMRIALRNLIDNALKYSQGTQHPVEIDLKAQARGIALRVRDFGPGIPVAERQRIFEPFYRIDRARTLGQGFGLGLALVKRICEAHGISITIEEPPGGGACFCLMFQGAKVRFKIGLSHGHEKASLRDTLNVLGSTRGEWPKALPDGQARFDLGFFATVLGDTLDLGQ